MPREDFDQQFSLLEKEVEVLAGFVEEAFLTESRVKQVYQLPVGRAEERLPPDPVPSPGKCRSTGQSQLQLLL